MSVVTSSIARSCFALTALVACDAAPDGAAAPAPEDNVAEPGQEQPVQVRCEVFEPPAELPIEEEEVPEPAHVFLSRYAPQQGLPGTEVAILGSFSVPNDEVEVTIGGAWADHVEDDFVLRVIVPEWASSGPLCVTVDDVTQCGDTFRVINSPEMYGFSPEVVALGAGDTRLVVGGDGFVETSQIHLDGTALETVYVSAQRLEAVAPASTFEAAGTRSIMVLTSRCIPPARAIGFSESMTLTVSE